MIVLNIFKIIALLICCTIATLTDLKHGTISNKLVLSFGIVGIILDIMSCFLLSSYENELFFLNATSVIGIAFLLYFLHIWAGGDCKLLVVVALLYPSQLYWRFDSTPFTLWYAVGFMFGLGFIYIFLDSIICLFKTGMHKPNKQSLIILKTTLVRYSKALIYMSALSHVYLYFVYPNIKLPGLVYSIISILFIWKLNSFEFYNSIPLMIAVGLFDLAMTVFTGNITISTYWGTYIIVFSFMLLRLFINKYNYQMIDTDKVEKGMILSQVSSLLMQNSKISGLPPLSDESLNSRLTDKEAESVKRWAKSKNGFAQITIVRKVPFAVFITLGTAMYLFTRGVLK